MAKKSPTRDIRLMAPLGWGLIAGLRGTAAMTVSSTVEAQLSGRGVCGCQRLGLRLPVTPPTGDSSIRIRYASSME